MEEYVIGIDVGSSKVYAAVGRIEDEESLQIMGISSSKCEGLNKGIVIDIENTAKAIEKAVGQLKQMVNCELRDAFLVIPGGICELIDSKGVVAINSSENTIKESDKERAIEASKFLSMSNDKEIIGVIPRDYIIDEYDKIKDPVGMNGNKLEVNAKIVTARSIVVNNLIKSVEIAGLNVKGIELKPIAACSVVVTESEKRFGAALIDVGGETIDISIFTRGELCYTANIPFGGQAITNDLSVGLKIPMDDAENMKLKYGTLRKSPSNDKIKCRNILGEIIDVNQEFMIDIIEARVIELLEFTRAELIKSGYEDAIEKVILVGGGLSLLKGIKELSESVLNKHVKIGSPDYIGAASPVFSNVVGVLKNVVDEKLKEKEKSEYEFLGNEFYDDDIYAERKGLAKRIKNVFSNLFS